MRKRKLDLQIECLRLLEKTRAFGPISRKDISIVLSATFERTIIPGSWALKRALKQLVRKGAVEESGNDKKPSKHYFTYIEQTYDFEKLIQLQNSIATEVKKEKTTI